LSLEALLDLLLLVALESPPQGIAEASCGHWHQLQLSA
jgi:hypothetical protein